MLLFAIEVESTEYTNIEQAFICSPGRAAMSLLRLNTQFGHYFFKNTKRAGPYYDADARNGVIVREFFAQLAETEQRLGSAKGIELTAYKFNDWPISTTDTTANPPNHLRLSHHGRLFATALGLVAFVYITRRIWRPRLCRAPPHDGF